MHRRRACAVSRVVVRLAAVGIVLTATGCPSPAARTHASPVGASARAGDAAGGVVAVRLPDFGVDVATGADGRAYVAVPSNRILIVDPTTATVAAEVRVDGEPYAVAVTPDARRAYAVDLRGEEVAVVDTARAEQSKRIPMTSMRRPARRPSAAMSRDGRWLYVGNAARDHLFVIDTAVDAVAHDVFLDFHPIDVARAGDGRTVWVAGCRLACVDGTLAAIDAQRGKEITRISVPFVPSGIVVTPDGSRAYVANGREAHVTVVDLRARTILTTIHVGAEPVGIAMDAPGRVVYVTSFREGTLAAIATATDSVVATARVGDSPRAVVVSRDGTRAFVTHSTSTLSIVDLARFGR